MRIEVGAMYEVSFEDCCVRGSFTSKLTRAQEADDDGKMYDVDTLDYGTELLFENGVELTAWSAVSLELVEECEIGTELEGES